MKNQYNGKGSPIKSKGKTNEVTNETNGDMDIKTNSGSRTFSKLLVIFLFGCGSIYLLTEYKSGPVTVFIEFAVPEEYGEIVMGHINELVPLVDTIKEQVKEHIQSVLEIVMVNEAPKDLDGEIRIKDVEEKNMQNEEDFSNGGKETISVKETKKAGEDIGTNNNEEKVNGIEMKKKVKEANLKEFKETKEVEMENGEKSKMSKVKEEEISAEEQKGETEEDIADKEAEKELQKRKDSIKEAAQEEEAFIKAQSQMEEAVKESVKWAAREQVKSHQIVM